MLIAHKVEILIGRNCFQHRDITWSYLRRGNEVLTQINIPQTIVPLTTRRIKLVLNSKIPGLKIFRYPPANRIMNRKLEKIMWLYSAKKNKAKAIDEYSTLYPLTNSDSPSERSKGALLVSANIETKYIRARGHKEIKK